ncbi:MAG: isoprenylcysteine carboxylmethyltransferase family protein [Anaerolineales bacterium]
MFAFDWIVAGVVVAGVFYISFVLTVPKWLAAVQKGQAVTLLPTRRGGKYPLWAQIILLVVGIALCVPLFYFGWIPLFTISTNIARILDIIGLILYLAGLGFTLWARRTLGKYWGLSSSRSVKLLDDHQLIQSGPYAFVRHPMYSGAWAFMFGLLLLYPTWAILILFISMLAAFSSRAHREEKALEERFGIAWQEYKKRTKMIVPYIY